MEKKSGIGLKLKKLYARLLHLDISGFLKSRQFGIFCIDNDIDILWNKVFSKINLGYIREGRASHSINDFPDDWSDSLLWEFEEDLFLERSEDFAEIIISLLDYYSKYNARISDGSPTPIEDYLIISVGRCLIDLGYSVGDLFIRAGYNYNEIVYKAKFEPLKKPLVVQKDEKKKHAALSDLSKKVFIVHGHDNEMKQTVARLLEKLGFEVTILHEQVNQGRHLLQKLKDNSDVGYAIVLLSPDDLGKEKTEEKFMTRARQNVIFEWGFFVNLLESYRVCIIDRNVEDRPSDYDGIIRIDYDEKGAWRGKLMKELKSIGYDINFEKGL
jgi:predicted nucleotide-binding protein